jgi:adenylyltransferase/sulfurtransferase
MLMEPSPSFFERYARQMRYAPLGEQGQQRLVASRVLLCGCGALGSVLSNTLVRAGVGHLRIVDRDFVELTNLQRQVLFDEEDVAAGLPKAVAAAAKLRRINSQVEVEPVVADFDHHNALALCEGVDCILDGTDNFETRYLLNDVSLRQGIPWVYGGCIGAEGQTMTILPHQTPCLRCLMPEPPPAGAAATCDTAGILAPIVNVIASYQAMEAMKILAGHKEAVQPNLLVFEMWENRVRQLRIAGLSEGTDCPACQGREFPWLEGRRGSHTVALCGRNAVQLMPSRQTHISLEELAGRLAGMGRVTHNPFLVRLEIPGYSLAVFGDGRAIVSGTDDIALARTLYARYVGT